MSTTPNDPTLEVLTARVAALELALASLQPHPPTPDVPSPAPTAVEKPAGTRRLLRRAVAAAASLVGARLTGSSKTALAAEISSPGKSAPCVCSSAIATVPAVRATGTGGAHGVDTSSDSSVGLFTQSGSGISLVAVGGGASATLPKVGPMAIFASGGPSYGLYATSDSNIGVLGQSNSSTGVSGQSDSGIGVLAQSTSGTALHAVADAIPTDFPPAAAIFAEGGSSYGLYATSTSTGVSGSSTSGDGVQGTSSDAGHSGVFGNNTAASGGYGVYGNSTSGTGVYGASTSGYGVWGTSPNQGVYGQSDSGNAVVGSTTSGTGVGGASDSGTGVYGYSASGYAGYFIGKLYKSGGGFQIDHPLDAAHKYLCHSFVESPDMKNLYDGMVTLDANGQAEVVLPTWFETLNTDVRYQLICLGSSAPVYIAEQLQNNRFTIAGGRAGMEVCWQVTGIRQDRWANAHRLPVEQDKPAEEQGYYLYPDLYGEPEEKSIIHRRYPDLQRPVPPQK